MPRIIHHTLLERLVRLPETRGFIDDFRQTADISLVLRDPLGNALIAGSPDAPLCRYLATTEAGRSLCRRAQQGLYLAAAQEANCCRCDAGLHEIASPLRFAERTAGYLVFRGVRTEGLEKRNLHRIRHLLSKADVEITSERLEALLAQSTLISEPTMRAAMRIVALAARHLIRQISSQHTTAERPLPQLTQKAQRFIRAHGLTESCTLPEIARTCAVSEAHLSRVFHESTGLTVSEYLSRLRVKHAAEMLKQGSSTITDIAFASGFQSISQFNRTFRKVSGTTPSRLRRGGQISEFPETEDIA